MNPEQVRQGRAAHKAGSRLSRLACVAVLGLLASGHVTTPAAAAAERRLVYSVGLDGPILPAVAKDLKHALLEAEEARAALLIVRLDTPGGLVAVAREMARDIGAAPMPVIVYVHPSGAHAESAGLFVTLAGDVAAMAPGTNIGSATPFIPARPQGPEDRALLRTLERKGRNDAVAMARSLAEQHGRNPELAERMVTKAANVSARVALRQRLIDVVAASERSLLRQLDGFQLKGPEGGTLRTAGLPIRHAAVDTALDDPSDSGDESSFIRQVGVLLLLGLAAALGIWALVRGRSAWRRRRWIWRRWRGKARARRDRP